MQILIAQGVDYIIIEGNYTSILWKLLWMELIFNVD